MKNIYINLFKQLLFTIIVISSCLSIVNVSANNSELKQQFESALESGGNSFLNSSRQYNSKLNANTALKSMSWAQSSQARFISKSDVVRSVKKRYNARVLKITLNEARAMYQVRVLMPSGKIKNINISARR